MLGVPPQLRLAVVEAMGPMSHLMPSEKLEEQLPKLIPGILALYKKHAEAFYISKVRSWGARSCCPGPVPDPGCASPWSPATAPG